MSDHNAVALDFALDYQTSRSVCDATFETGGCDSYTSAHNKSVAGEEDVLSKPSPSLAARNLSPGGRQPTTAETTLFLDSIGGLSMLSLEQARMLEAVLAQEPHRSRAYLWDLLIRSYHFLRQPDEVLRAGREAATACARAVESRARTVATLIDRRALADAAALLEAAPDEVKPKDSIQLQTARLEYETGACAAAAHRCETILETAPGWAAARSLQLQILYRQSDYIALAKAVLHVGPQHGWELEMFRTPERSATACGRIIEGILAKRDAETARSFIETLAPAVSASPAVQLQHARLDFETGAYASAVARCEEILAADPGNGPAFGVRLCALAEMGAFDIAFETVLNAPDPIAGLDWAILKLFTEYGKSRAADSGLYRAAIDRIARSKAPHDRLWRARLHRAAQDFDAAGEELRGFGEEEQQTKPVLMEAARLHFQTHAWKAGTALFEKIVQDDTVLPQFRKTLKNCVACVDTLERFYRREADPPRDYKIPDAVFEAAFLGCSNVLYAPHQSKVALIGATMAAGGAEHVLGNAHLGLRTQAVYDSELWLYSHAAALNHDFFLKELGIEIGPEGQCYPLVYETETVSPFSWIPWSSGRNAQAVYQEIMRRRPEVVHAWQDSTNLEVAFAGVLAGVPKIVVHPHNMRPDLVHKTFIAQSFRRAYKAMLTRSDVHLVCVSDASLRDYLEWLGVERNERHHVVYNGFRWGDCPGADERRATRRAVRTAFGLSETDAVVGAIFRMVDVKRPLLWLDVAAAIVARQPDIRFLMFGAGPELERAERHAAALGIARNVVFAGLVPEAGRKSVAFDVLLHTSESEGLPTGLLEAQANGIPVVASDVGGVAETLTDELGTLIPTSDPEPYAEAVLRFLADPPGPQVCQRVAAETRSRFGVEAMVERLAAIYRMP